MSPKYLYNIRVYIVVEVLKMNCNHDCQKCPASSFIDGETNCILLNEEIHAIRAKKEAYKEQMRYYKEKER